jgi:hypothetical protein
MISAGTRRGRSGRRVDSGFVQDLQTVEATFVRFMADQAEMLAVNRAVEALADDPAPPGAFVLDGFEAEQVPVGSLGRGGRPRSARTLGGDGEATVRPGKIFFIPNGPLRLPSVQRTADGAGASVGSDIGVAAVRRLSRAGVTSL